MIEVKLSFFSLRAALSSVLTACISCSLESSASVLLWMVLSFAASSAFTLEGSAGAGALDAAAEGAFAAATTISTAS